MGLGSVTKNFRRHFEHQPSSDSSAYHALLFSHPVIHTNLNEESYSTRRYGRYGPKGFCALAIRQGKQDARVSIPLSLVLSDFPTKDIKSVRLAYTRLSNLFQSHFNKVFISPSKRMIELFDISQNHSYFGFRSVKLFGMA
jgi:hypothetical protein